MPSSLGVLLGAILRLSKTATDYAKTRTHLSDSSSLHVAGFLHVRVMPVHTLFSRRTRPNQILPESAAIGKYSRNAFKLGGCLAHFLKVVIC